MITDIFKAALSYFNKKICKLAKDEKRLSDLEKDVDLIKSQDEGRLSFTRGLMEITGSLRVIDNEIKHIIERMDKLDERMERRHIITPVEFDRRQS